MILIKLMLRVAVLLLLMNLLPASIEASLVEEKLSLERSIQERTERLVEKIIGTNEMVVLVSVELEKEVSKPVETRSSSIYPGMRMSEEEYLPGITYSYYPLDTYTPATKGTIIKRITVLITLDETIPENLVNRISTEVNDLLGLNRLRGDVVSVQKITFAKHLPTWRDYVKNWSGQLYWLSTLLLATIFLFGPLRSFFSTIVKAMELRINAETRIRGVEQMGYNMNPNLTGPAPGPLLPGGPPAEAAAERRRPTSPKHEEYESGKRFGFINDENVKNLMYLLKKEPAEKIAVIISYLTPQLASQVLSSLPPQMQSQIAINLSQVKILDPEVVTQIEKDLKNKIDYLLGGEDYFITLLDQVDRETQENILNTMELENPTLAERLRRSLFFFDDVIILEKPALQRLIRESQRHNYSLAVALKNSTEEIKSKVMESLTEGGQAMLAEQIDLLGDITEKRSQEEQKLIAHLARDLEKSGEILIDRTKKFEQAPEATTEMPVV